MLTLPMSYDRKEFPSYDKKVMSCVQSPVYLADMSTGAPRRRIVISDFNPETYMGLQTSLGRIDYMRPASEFDKTVYR